MLRKKIFWLIISIIFSIGLLFMNLQISRSAFNDLPRLSITQRSEYKTKEMEQAVEYYYKQKPPNDPSLTTFLKNTQKNIDRVDYQFISIFDTIHDFPISWTNELPTQWRNYTTAKNFFLACDSTGEAWKNFKNHIMAYKNSEYNRVVTLALPDGQEALLVWVLVPAPIPESVDYIYYSFVPTYTIMWRVNEIRNNYLILFTISAGLAGAFLMILPILMKRHSNGI